NPTVVWLAGGVLEARMTPTGLAVAPDFHPEVALAPPAPNPLRGSQLVLRFTAPAGPARLELYDALRRRVLTRAAYASGGAAGGRPAASTRCASPPRVGPRPSGSCGSTEPRVPRSR